MSEKKDTQKKHESSGLWSTPPRFSIQWIWIVIFIIAIQLVSPSGDLRPDFKYENANMTASSRARFRRDTTKLGNAVQNLAHLARVANGIALEIGLVDGSIQPGEAVSELLLMGDLKLEDIISLNQDSIDSVLDSLSQKTKSNKDVEKLEKRLISLEDVRKISSNLQNLKEITGKKEFEASFEAVEDMVAQKANLTTAGETMIKWLPPLVHLDDMAKIGFKENTWTDALYHLNGVARAVDKLKAFQASFDPIKKLIEKAKKMSENSKFIDYLATENKFRTSEEVVYKDVTPLLLEKFKKVHEDSQAASSAQKEFESILKLVQTRSPLHRQTFHHTAGFPRGSEDLKGLEQSIEDPSIISRISNGESVKTHLKEALGLFNNLEKKIDGISLGWKSLEAEYKSVNEVVSTVVNLGKLPDVSQSISATVDALVNCDKGGYPKSKLDKGFATSIETLSNQVNGISSFDYLGDFANLDPLKKDFDTNGLSSDQQREAITNIFSKWKTDEALKTFVKNVKQLDADLKLFLDFLKKNPTKEIKLNTLTTHLTAIAQPKYTTFLKCVNDLQIEGFPVKSMIEFIRSSKNIQVPQGAKDVISKVTQSGSSLTNAQNVAGKFKGDGKLTPKIEVFKSSFEQKNYEDVSKKLGLGVQGLAAILKVRTAKIDDLVQNTEKILNDAKTNGQSAENQKSLQQLTAVKKVLKSIDTFLQTSKGLQAFRRKRNAGFESFQELFRDAASVQGATIVMDNFREAIDALKNVKVTGVDELEALDLDFAKFNIGDAVPSLIAMDKFFEKYFTHFSGVPGARNSLVTPKPGQNVSSASADNLVEASTEKEGGHVILIVCIIGGVIIFIIVLLAILWCNRKRTPPPRDDNPDVITPDVITPVNPEVIVDPKPVVPKPAVVVDVPNPAVGPQPPLEQNGQNLDINVDVPHVNFPAGAIYQPAGGGDDDDDIVERNGADEVGGQRNVGPAANGQGGRHQPAQNNLPAGPGVVQGAVVQDANAVQGAARGAGGHRNAGEDQGNVGEGAENRGGDNQPVENNLPVGPVAQGAVVQPNENAIVAPGAGAGGQNDPPVENPDVHPPAEQEQKELELDKTQRSDRRLIGNKNDVRMSRNLASETLAGLEKKIPPASLIEDMNAEWNKQLTKKPKYLPSKELKLNQRRKKTAFNIDRMAKTTDDKFVDMSMVNENIYIAQHPIGPQEDGKIDTREPFSEAVIENDIDVIVQVRGADETLPAYYPPAHTELRLGDHVIKNLGPVAANGCIVHELEFSNTKSNKSVTVNHVEFTGWAEGQIPDEETVWNMIQSAGSFGTKKLFHCSDGLKRAVILAAIAYGLQLHQSKGIEHIDEVIEPILEARYGCELSPLEMVFIVLTITKAVMTKKGYGYCPSYSILKYIYEKMQQNHYYDKLPGKHCSKSFLIAEYQAMKARCEEDRQKWLATNTGKEILQPEINFDKLIARKQENSKKTKSKEPKKPTTSSNEAKANRTKTKNTKKKASKPKRSGASDVKSHSKNGNKPGTSDVGKKERKPRSKGTGSKDSKKKKTAQQTKKDTPTVNDAEYDPEPDNMPGTSDAGKNENEKRSKSTAGSGVSKSKDTQKKKTQKPADNNEDLGDELSPKEEKPKEPKKERKLRDDPPTGDSKGSKNKKK